MAEFPQHTRVLIIGGGVVGCSVAYHLAHLGWNDVVLVERKQLTSGTTWHAAGLIAQLRATMNMTRLAKYSQELYRGLEAETGIATGFKRNGSLAVALCDERMEEFLRNASMAKTHGVEVNVVTARDCGDMYPYLNTDGVVGGLHIPLDGQGDPANIAMALARGARNKGVKVFENTKVEAIHTRNGRATGARTDKGEITADIIVNCAGMWGHEVGQMAGVNVPLHACEHFYILTEAVPDLPGNLPVLRVPDECAYYKEDAGKILLGAFEPVSKPWGMDGIPTISASMNCRRISTISSRCSRKPSSACRCLKAPGFIHFSTGRRASRRTTATCSARPRRLRISSSLPASTRSASSRQVAPARRWPSGSSRVRRLSTCGMSTYAHGAVPGQPHLPQEAGDGDSRPALCRPLPIPAI